MKAEDSIFAAGCSQEVQARFKGLVAAIEKERGGRPLQDPDGLLMRLFCQWIARTPGEPIEQMLHLATIAKRFVDAGRHDEEFNEPLIDAVTALERRALVNALLSEIDEASPPGSPSTGV